MGVNLQQQDDGSLSLVGTDETSRGVFAVSSEYIATSVDKTFFVADRSYVVKNVSGRVTVAGTDASAVSAVVNKVPNGTAITSGTNLTSDTMDLKGTANTKQDLTLSTTASDLVLAAGDALAIDFTGTLTAATGVITVSLAPR